MWSEIQNRKKKTELGCAGPCGGQGKGHGDHVGVVMMWGVIMRWLWHGVAAAGLGKLGAASPSSAPGSWGAPAGAIGVRPQDSHRVHLRPELQGTPYSARSDPRAQGHERPLSTESGAAPEPGPECNSRLTMKPGKAAPTEGLGVRGGERCGTNHSW